MGSDGTLYQRLKRKIADDVLPAFNLTTHRRLEDQQREQQETAALLATIAHDRDRLAGEVQAALAEIRRLGEQLREQGALLSSVASQRDNLHQLLNEAREAKNSAAGKQAQAASMPLPETIHEAGRLPYQPELTAFLATLNTETDEQEVDALYYALEISLRGSEALVKARQAQYLPDLPFTHPHLPVADLGCGRGEFLELLHERNIHAVGVDSNARNVGHLRAKGLEVVHQGANEYLESLAPESLAAVTAFEVAEHLPHRYLRDMLRLAYAKIAPGGFIMLETANPYCLEGFRTYYLDPTHQNPIPPELLMILMQFYGFTDLRVFYQNPVVETIDAAQPHKAREYYLTYAVMGVKSDKP